ncbi:MAG: hypothetical protein ACK5Q5_11650 [Planctomycetaceae bacterium]
MDDLPPVPKAIAGSLDNVANSASMRRMKIPSGIVQKTVDDYIARATKLFEEAGGKIIRNGGPAPTTVIDGKTYKTLGRMNYNNKTITLYDGHQIQDVVEELAHFKQAMRDGYWGSATPLPESVRGLWEKQIDTLFSNLGFVPE